MTLYCTHSSHYICEIIRMEYKNNYHKIKTFKLEFCTNDKKKCINTNYRMTKYIHDNYVFLNIH